MVCLLGCPQLRDVDSFWSVMMSLDNTRSCVSVCTPGHRGRGSLRFLEWFYFRGNKKVTRIMKTNVQKRFWPGLTVHPRVHRSNTVIPEGVSVKSGHTRRVEWSDTVTPGGITVKYGHPRGESEPTGNFWYLGCW